jgi:hypothetical protein
MKKGKEKMLTVKEAAQAIGESERSIRHWAKSQKLPGAVLEETPAGSYWLIPESALKNLENPGRGRPPKPKKEKGKA